MQTQRSPRTWGPKGPPPRTRGVGTPRGPSGSPRVPKVAVSGVGTMSAAKSLGGDPHPRDLAWPGLAGLGLADLAWLGLSWQTWLGLAWLGLAWLGLAWDHRGQGPHGPGARDHRGQGPYSSIFALLSLLAVCLQFACSLLAVCLQFDIKLNIVGLEIRKNLKKSLENQRNLKI